MEHPTPTFTSSRVPKGRYEYVILHLPTGDTIEFNEDVVTEVEFNKDGYLIIHMKDNCINVFRAWMSIEYKPHHIN